MTSCSSCSALLSGPFCGHCGVRAPASAKSPARLCQSCSEAVIGVFCHHCGVRTVKAQPVKQLATAAPAASNTPASASPASPRSRALNRTPASTQLPAIQRVENAERAPSPPSPITPRGTQRDRVLDELVNTEKDYVSDLRTICDVFVKPLKDGEILNVGEHFWLFANIEQLYEVNSQLLTRLIEPGGRERAGAVFAQMAAYLKAYGVYCSNQTAAYDTYANLSKRKDGQAFLAYCRRKPECKNLDLMSLLVKPLQRICKYPLLLNELLKCTPESHADYAALSGACAKVADVVAHVNEQRREHERNEKMVEIAQRVVCSADCEILAPTRRFHGEGEVTFEAADGRTRKKMHYFLFNDLLLLTKKKSKKRYNLKAYLQFCHVNVVPGDNPRAFEVLHIPDKKVWTLCFDSEVERDEMLASIGELVATHLEELYGFGGVTEPHAAASSPGTSPPVLGKQPSRRAPTLPQAAGNQYQALPPAASAAQQAHSGRATAAAPASAEGNYTNLPPGGTNRDSFQKAQRALKRLTTVRSLSVNATPVNPVPLHASAEQYNIPKPIALATSEQVELRCTYLTDEVTISMARDDFSFLEVRKRVHERFHLHVPRQFVLLRHASGVITDQQGLMKALEMSGAGAQLELAIVVRS